MKIYLQRRDMALAYHALCRSRKSKLIGAKRALMVDRAAEIVAAGYLRQMSMALCLHEAAKIGAHGYLLARIEFLNVYSVLLGLLTSLVCSYLPFHLATTAPGLAFALAGWLLSFLGFSRLYCVLYSVSEIDRVRRALEIVSCDPHVSITAS